MPLCCLPNDQLNGFPRGCLSQRQLQNCWGNILFYWKWFPSNCHVPYLDSWLSNTQQKGLNLQGRRPCTVRKELGFCLAQVTAGQWASESVVGCNQRDRITSFYPDRQAPFHRDSCFFPSCWSHKWDIWTGRWHFRSMYICLAVGPQNPAILRSAPELSRWMAGKGLSSSI